MFVISYAENCTANPLENMYRHNVDQPWEFIIFTVGFFAFVTNSLTVAVLYRPRAKCRLGSIRLTLGVLSFTEAVLNAFVIIDALNNICRLKDWKYVSATIYSTIVFWNINAFVCTRNWLVALIAFSRSEGIFRPMQSRSNKFFSTRTIKVCVVLLFVLSYGLSVVRTFFMKVIVCPEKDLLIFRPLLGNRSEFLFFDTYVFFAYQSVLPVVMVAVATSLMTYIIIRSRPIMAGGGQMYHQQSRQGVQRRATRTVLFLAIVFTAMETPVFLGVILRAARVIRDEYTPLFIYVSRLLVVSDSCCNVIVYVLTNDRFRAEFLRLVWDVRYCGRRRYPAYQHNGYSAAAELLTLRPAMASMLGQEAAHECGAERGVDLKHNNHHLHQCSDDDDN